MMRKAILAAATCLLMSPLAALAQNAQGQSNPFQGGGASAPASPAPGPTARAPARSAAAAAPSGNQYHAEAEAKQACPSDTVVWVNLSGSKAWHVSGDKYYGHTKRGAYMCQQAAEQAGYHASGSQTHKAKAQTH